MRSTVLVAADGFAPGIGRTEAPDAELTHVRAQACGTSFLEADSAESLYLYAVCTGLLARQWRDGG